MPSDTGSSMADSAAVGQLVENSVPLGLGDRSVLETVIDYMDSNDRQGAALYLEAMSRESLARVVWLLNQIAPMAKSKLLQK